jgi:hypothetical protein
MNMGGPIGASWRCIGLFDHGGSRGGNAGAKLNMNNPGPDGTLEFRLHALIAQRYRGAYLHDLRGGLQVMQNAIEVLVRAVNAPRDNSALITRTSELAQRALAAHGELIDATVDRLVIRSDPPASCRASTIVNDVLRFLRSEFASKSITLEMALVDEFKVAVPASRLRLALMVVLTAVLEGNQVGAINISLHRHDDRGVIEFTVTPSASGRAGQPAASVDIGPVDGALGLPTHRQLVEIDGGRVNFLPGTDGAWREELIYPIAAAG